MREIKRLRQCLPWLGSTVVLSLATGSTGNVARAQIGPTLSYACYVPDVGAVYRIKEAGLPQECFDVSHVEFSWGDIPDGAVTNAKIANRAVQASQIALSAVSVEHIADNAVRGSAIQNQAISTTKMQDGAITPAKLAADFRFGDGLTVDGELAVTGRLTLGAYDKSQIVAVPVEENVSREITCNSVDDMVLSAGWHFPGTVNVMKSVRKQDQPWAWEFALWNSGPLATSGRLYVTCVSMGIGGS